MSQPLVSLSGDCPFCNLPPERVIIEGEHVRVFRDGFPLTEGHTLVIPREHSPHVFQVSAETHDALWRTVAAVQRGLCARYGVTDFTIAVNDGPIAGQTIAHAHVHVIPRRIGDVPEDRARGGIRWLFPDKAAYW